jgi:hypothetical protein
MNIKSAKITALQYTKGNKPHDIALIVSQRTKSVLKEDFIISLYFHYLLHDMSFEYDEHINNEINK